MKIVRKMMQAEDGAITVDWVVLTAAIVTLGLAVGVTISSPANDLASDINSTMAAMAPTTY